MSAPRVLSRPEPGYFRLRLVKGGPWTFARIWLDRPTDPLTGEPIDRSIRLMAEAAGEPAEVALVWTHGRPITRQEFEYLRGVTDHAIRYGTDDPMGRPRVPVDLGKTSVLF